MLGISWRRQQGLADPLLKRMLAERGLDNVPQWTKEGDVRMRANRRWTALAVDRDGTVARQRCNIADVATATADIKKQAIALGADLVGCCALSPIMIDQDYHLPHESVISIVMCEDYANVLEGSRAIEGETYTVYVRLAEIVTELASLIRAMGFPAWAHHNGVRFAINSFRKPLECGGVVDTQF